MAERDGRKCRERAVDWEDAPLATELRMKMLSAVLGAAGPGRRADEQVFTRCMTERSYQLEQ
jgi:hypothetical protein